MYDSPHTQKKSDGVHGVTHTGTHKNIPEGRREEVIHIYIHASPPLLVLHKTNMFQITTGPPYRYPEQLMGVAPCDCFTPHRRIVFFFGTSEIPLVKEAENNPHHTSCEGVVVLQAVKSKETPPLFYFPTLLLSPLKTLAARTPSVAEWLSRNYRHLGQDYVMDGGINTGCFVWQGAAQNGVRPC